MGVRLIEARGHVLPFLIFKDQFLSSVLNSVRILFALAISSSSSVWRRVASIQSGSKDCAGGGGDG